MVAQQLCWPSRLLRFAAEVDFFISLSLFLFCAAYISYVTRPIVIRLCRMFDGHIKHVAKRFINVRKKFGNLFPPKKWRRKFSAPFRKTWRLDRKYFPM